MAISVHSLKGDPILSSNVPAARRDGTPQGAGRMRTLDIDWADLEIAFRDATGSESWLDRDSGEVLTVIAGFDDERDVREKLKRYPGRFVRVLPLEASFTREVLDAFIARLEKGRRRKALEDASAGPGGIARTMALLREDKPTLAAFARFEQSELVRRIEAFLADNGLRSGTTPPSPELFEGLAP